MNVDDYDEMVERKHNKEILLYRIIVAVCFVLIIALIGISLHLLNTNRMLTGTNQSLNETIEIYKNIK
ncbi:MAG: hypothetical protein V1690_00465 [Candidatus Moraniibacteriota bacterium]